MTQMSSRYSQAVEYARHAHFGQVRKGGDVPYLYHLVGVSSLVMEFGGSEDQAIAGLLHDVVEDCGAHHEAIVRDTFGDGVADIVMACTDGTFEGKATHVDADARRADWLQRKQAYLAHLADASDATLLVSACDKLHNARAIVQDLESPSVSLAVFDRFTGGRDGTLAYYEALAQTFNRRGVRAAAVLDAVVERMHGLAGKVSREGMV